MKIIDNGIKIAFFNLLFLIAIMPLFFGGNASLYWSAMSMIVSASIIFWSAAVIRNNDTSIILERKVYFILIPFLLAMLWALLQIFLDISWFNSPLWEIASQALDRELQGSISLDANKSIEGFMKLMSYGMVFWISLQLGRDEQMAKKIFLTIAISCAVYALYGLLAHLLSFDNVLWYKRIMYHDSVTSTFINRNSFATYAGIGIIISFGLLFSAISRNIYASNRREYYQAILINLGSKGLPLFSIIAVLIAALIMSNSRAGLVATMIAAVSFIIFSLISRTAKKYKSLVFGAIPCLIILFIIMLNMGGDDIGERFQYLDQDVTMRMKIYEITMNAIGDFFFVGSGLGTFRDVFHIYVDSEFAENYFVTIYNAHNSYLELLLELGIIGFSFFAFSVAAAIYVCCSGMLNRKKNLLFPVSALAVSVLVWSHALFDFSIEIPAISLIYAVIMGVGCAQSWSSKADSVAEDGVNKLYLNLLKKSAIFIGIIMLMISFYYTLAAVKKIGTGQNIMDVKLYKEVPKKDLERIIEKQINATSFQNDGHSLQDLGLLKIAISKYYKDSDEVYKRLLSSAITDTEIGLSLSPVNPFAWFRLSILRLIVEGPSKKAADALYMSALNGTYNYDILDRRLEIASILWDYFDDDQKEVFNRQKKIKADRDRKKSNF